MVTRSLKYLTEKQVTEITNIATQTLRNNRSKGQGLPYVKISRSVRYSLEDVIEYMEGHRVVPSGTRVSQE